MIEKRYTNIRTYEELEQFLSDYVKNSNDRLYHFTTYDSLLKIIKNKTFMLTLIGASNDRTEKLFSGETPYYIMSYKEDNIENVNMWYMYGKKSGIKVRLDFSKEELFKCLEKKMWSYKEKGETRFSKEVDLFGQGPFYTLSNVAYLSKEKKKDRIDYKLGIYRKPFNSLKIQTTEEFKNRDGLAGFIKYDIWEAEKEVRLRIFPWGLNPGENPPKRMFLYLTPDLIKTFHITFNPWMSLELKEEIKKSLNGLCEDFEFTFSNSAHDGEIDEF